jgi:preprotein translocase subunit SecF
MDFQFISKNRSFTSGNFVGSIFGLFFFSYVGHTSIGSFIPPETLEKEQEESENDDDWTTVELSDEQNSDQNKNRNEKNNNSQIDTLKRKERRKDDESETTEDLKSKEVQEEDEKDDDEEEEDYPAVIITDRIPSSSLSSLLSCYQEEIEGVLISIQQIHCKIGNKIYAHNLE